MRRRPDRAWLRRHLLSALVVSLASEAQAAPLSAKEFLARMEADPRLELLAARLDRAEAEVTAAGRLPNPTIGYDREEVFVSGDRSADNFVRASLSIEISGRRGRTLDAARAGAAATKDEIARARQMLLLD